MSTIGAGVREIKSAMRWSISRDLHCGFADAIHVLHAFEKKTQKTARRDLELAAARLRQSKRGTE